jgi:hypothetical protein
MTSPLDQLLPSEKQRLLQILEQAAEVRTPAQAEKVLQEFRQTLESALPLTAEQLQQKRDERLYREAWESLTPEQQKAFEAKYGTVGTMRRIAEQAKREVDFEWEQRQLTKFDEGYTAAAREGRMFNNTAPGTDYSKLIEASDQLEQWKRERLVARKQRELQAEQFNDEAQRILYGMDADTQARFVKLMKAEPSPLAKLQHFAREQGINSISDVNNSADLYNLGWQQEQEQSTEQEQHPYRYIEANEVDALYNQALNDMNKGE